MKTNTLCKKINETARLGGIVTIDHKRVMGARVKDDHLEVDYWDDPLTWVEAKVNFMNEHKGYLELETT